MAQELEFDPPALVFPILSSRSHETGLYNPFLDGNILYHLSLARAYKNAWLILPEFYCKNGSIQGNIFEQHIIQDFERYVNKNYPEVRLVYKTGLIYSENAARTRAEMVDRNKDVLNNIIDLMSSETKQAIVISDFVDLAEKLGQPESQVKTPRQYVFNCNTRLETYIGVGRYNKMIYSIDRTILGDIIDSGEVRISDFKTKNTLKYIVDMEVQKKLAEEAETQFQDFKKDPHEYIKTIVKNRHLDLINFESLDTPSIELLKNPKNKLFFPMRASDPAYNIYKVLDLAVALGMDLYVIDPNNSLDRILEQRLYVKNPKVYKANSISQDKRLYYNVLTKSPNIPYYEDPLKLIHPGYVEMNKLGANFIGIK